jgi:predicted glycosyltransferase
MRILFHYTHKQTLGHTTRSISLINALCRQHAEVLVLQGGIPQPFVCFPVGCKTLNIPLPFDDRTSFESRGLPVAAAKRAQFILKAAADFSPDVFITEFFPFGRLAYLPELLPTLRYLRKKGARMIASIGYPLLIDLDRLHQDKKFAQLHRAVLAFYDKFLIHTPEGLENAYIEKTIPSPVLSLSYAAIMNDLKKKIIYTGYILPDKIITGGAQLDHIQPGIVVSRGGGAVYPNLITLAIDAQRLLDPQGQTVIVSGPATTAEEMNHFQSCIKPHDRVVLAGHINNLDELLKDCKVSVSLCGYNTSVQLMRHGTPSVIVPYRNRLSKTSTNDQIARAELFQEHFQGLVLDYDTLTAESLAGAIQKQMSSPRPAPAPDSWFTGADLSARFIVEGTAG